MANEILDEVKKAIDLFMDKTYNETDFYSHILQIIKDQNQDAEIHRKQLERLLFKIDEIHKVQLQINNGHRNQVPIVIKQQKDLFIKKDNLLRMGYSIMQFKIQTEQGKLL